MRPLHKGLILCGVHLLLVASLGGKLLYDRATRPRVWARAAPYDPSLPVRGRYVSLQLEVLAPDIPPPPERDTMRPGHDPEWWRTYPVILSVDDESLVARRDRSVPEEAYWSADNAIRLQPGPEGSSIAVLAEPVLYFIPEHIPDPSRRQPGEELWVEVTLPRKGPPRPIRLGVKKDGTLTPLDIN